MRPVIPDEGPSVPATTSPRVTRGRLASRKRPGDGPGRPRSTGRSDAVRGRGHAAPSTRPAVTEAASGSSGNVSPCVPVPAASAPMAAVERRRRAVPPATVAGRHGRKGPASGGASWLGRVTASTQASTGEGRRPRHKAKTTRTAT